MTPAPKRRWFRWSLRTMFVVVTVFGVVLGWLCYEVNWIQQRRAFLSRNPSQLASYFEDHDEDWDGIPVVRRLLGDRPVYWLDVYGRDLVEARKLFPEAHFYDFDDESGL